MSGEPTPHPDVQEWYCATCDRSYGAGTAFCPEDGTRLVRLTEGDAMIGKVIDGRFTIRERLGQGGMGVVYRAWQASVGREVAIKMIRPRPGHDASTAKRFLREAKLSSQLSQPSTVGVIDFGQSEDGTLYLVMELLRGRTLGEVLRDQGRMSPERVVRIGTQVCDALEAAQRLGIVHRDVKPANVMILDDPPGRDLIKVLDFGLAKVIDSDESTVTQSGRMVGTPSHLPPEVALGAGATHRSDLYAVGVMLFEMLDGRPPFSADNVNMMVAMHAYQPAPELGPHVPKALAQVVARTLAKRPEARPETAAQLRTMLEGALRGEMPATGSPVEVTADSDEQRRLSLTKSSPVRSPEALAETLRKPKTRPPVNAEVRAAGAAIDAAAAAAAAASGAAAGDATGTSTTASSSSSGALAASPATTAEAAAALRRPRWPLLVLLFALLGGGAAIVLAKLGGSDSPTAPATITDAASSVATGDTDAVVVDPATAADAGVIDAPSPPIDAPIDAPPPVDAATDARRRGTEVRRGRDAGTTTSDPPPPPKRDAGPCHPWEDDC